MHVAAAQVVPDLDCSSELIQTLEEVSVVLATDGISEPFLQALDTVTLVAGDIPQASAFRNQLDATISAYKEAVSYQSLGNVSFSALAIEGATGVKTRPASAGESTEFKAGAMVVGALAVMSMMVL
jgi:hypothetical protein